MNILLALYLLAIAPKLLLDRVLKGKRHPGFLQRLGFNLPQCPKRCIWIHAVSLGEVKAASALIKELRKKTTTFILLTTTTATGQTEAQNAGANATAYLPLDFSFTVRKWVKFLNPSLFILIETDLWPNLLKALQKNGTQIILASGKMSDRTFKRLQFFPRFAKRLLGRFNAICVQNEEYAELFRTFTPNVHVTGNLKLDITPAPTTPLPFPKPAITISCTHPGEEEPLIDALLGGPWHIFLAPRHPERFAEVAKMLTQKKIPFSRVGESPKGQIHLVDAMGKLPSCYAHSDLAILGGSFVPNIGGHNLLEPLLYSTPVFFGPYTHRQKEFRNNVLDACAGIEITIPDLRSAVISYFAFPKEKMQKAAKKLILEGRGSSERTVKIIKFEEKDTGC